MIGFATPEGRSCITVDACRRLCTGCTDSGRIGRNTVGLQELCVCMAGGCITGEDAALHWSTLRIRSLYVSHVR